MRIFSRTGLLCAALAVALIGCGDDGDDDGGTETDAGGTETDAGTTVDADLSNACALAAPRCLDQTVADLSLQDTVAETGIVSETMEGDDFVSVVDATAGGSMQASSNPYLYLRFTEDGLVKVPIDDETALESQEWHVAARRYIVRLNSGVSGPSCVQSSMQAAGTYAELNAVPGDAVFMEEAYYDDACAMIEDDSGLSGNPNVLFDPWWEYQPDLFCLSTTLIPWLIELEDGRVVKLVMEGYYGENQEGCNTGAGGQMMSGVLTWRWQFLPTE